MAIIQAPRRSHPGVQTSFEQRLGPPFTRVRQPWNSPSLTAHQSTHPPTHPQLLGVHLPITHKQQTLALSPLLTCPGVNLGIPCIRGLRSQPYAQCHRLPSAQAGHLARCTC